MATAENGRPLAVYICLRQYDPSQQLTVHLKGMGLRVYEWTPAEVQQILIRAFTEERQRNLEAKRRASNEG